MPGDFYLGGQSAAILVFADMDHLLVIVGNAPPQRDTAREQMTLWRCVAWRSRSMKRAVISASRDAF